MKRIEKLLDEEPVKYEYDGEFASVEFWTDAGQDIYTSFEYNGTAKDFVDQFRYQAEAYDVDDEAKLWIGSLGKNGCPDTIRGLLDDCEEAKATLMRIADKLDGIFKSKEEHHPRLCGFVFCHGEKDFELFETCIKREDEEVICEILRKYDTTGTSERNCYDKIKDLVCDFY